MTTTGLSSTHNSMDTMPHNHILTHIVPLHHRKHRLHDLDFVFVPTHTTPQQVRATHILCKHMNSRNPVSRRTNESTQAVSVESAHGELNAMIEEFKGLGGGQALCDAFCKKATERSDCGETRGGGRGGDVGGLLPEEWSSKRGGVEYSSYGPVSLSVHTVFGVLCGSSYRTASSDMFSDMWCVWGGCTMVYERRNWSEPCSTSIISCTRQESNHA